MEAKKIPKRLLFVGGDMRQMRAVNRIAEHDVEVCVLGFDENDLKRFSERVYHIDSLEEINSDFDAVILPLPYTVDGEKINTINTKCKIGVSELLQKLSQGTIVLAGKCDKKLLKSAENKGLSVIDYFEREDLQILNAIPTAEGAIQIAMEEIPYTVHSSKCLVLGNGRIGKILAKMLYGIGADVTIAARKSRDRLQAFSFGIKSIPVCNLYEEIGRFDIIFNTIPSLMIDSDMLTRTGRNTLIIDLASRPGGVDFESARKMGIKVIWALSLPGKVAPDTAGDIIGKTILNILEELEER